MPVKNVVNNQDDLWRWFEKLNCPKWNLYRGFHNKLPFNQIIYKQEDDNKSVEDSFAELMELINMQSSVGAQFTIYVPYISGNKGGSMFYGVGAFSGTRSAALAGAPQLGMVSINEIDQRIAKERQLWDMERKIEDLQAAERGRMSMWESLCEKVIEDVDFNQLSQSISGLVAGLFTKRPVSLQGVPGDPIHAHKQGGFEYKEEVILPFLDAIRVHFETDEAFADFLQQVQEKFEQNPTLFITMITNG